MSPRQRPSAAHIIGFDDAPFARSHRGDIGIVGAVFAGPRLEGVVSGKVRRDGRNSTQVLAELVTNTRFGCHLQLVMLQGIALGGFNVVDLQTLHERTGLPVLVVARKRPDFAAIRRALVQRVPGGARKWRLIEAAGPGELLAGLFVQRVGISAAAARRTIERTAIHGSLPEPLRVAHLIAGGVTRGQCRGRA